VKLQHLVKPGVERGSNPYHFVIVHVDGEKLDMEVIAVDWGSGFQPYRSNKVELQDPAELACSASLADLWRILKELLDSSDPPQLSKRRVWPSGSASSDPCERDFSAPPAASSFAPRTALHRVSRKEMLIAASSGNFGQALAYACSILKKSCIVVMPTSSAKVKIGRCP